MLKNKGAIHGQWNIQLRIFRPSSFRIFIIFAHRYDVLN
jgi:hypothetical protein